MAIAFNFAASYDATGDPAAPQEYGLVQTLADTLRPDTTYTLRVQVGNIDSGTGMNGAFFDLSGFPGYRVELLAGGEVIAQDADGLSATLANGTFATSVVTFSTGSAHPHLGDALGIRLVNRNRIDGSAPGSDLEVDFDNVRLSAEADVHPTSIAVRLAPLLAAPPAGPPPSEP